MTIYKTNHRKVDFWDKSSSCKSAAQRELKYIPAFQGISQIYYSYWITVIERSKPFHILHKFQITWAFARKLCIRKSFFRFVAKICWKTFPSNIAEHKHLTHRSLNGEIFNKWFVHHITFFTIQWKMDGLFNASKYWWELFVLVQGFAYLKVRSFQLILQYSANSNFGCVIAENQRFTYQVYKIEYLVGTVLNFTNVAFQNSFCAWCVNVYLPDTIFVWC